MKNLTSKLFTFFSFIFLLSCLANFLFSEVSQLQKFGLIFSFSMAFLSLLVNAISEKKDEFFEK